VDYNGFESGCEQFRRYAMALEVEATGQTAYRSEGKCECPRSCGEGSSHAFLDTHIRRATAGTGIVTVFVSLTEWARGGGGGGGVFFFFGGFFFVGGVVVGRVFRCYLAVIYMVRVLEWDE